MSDMLDVIKPKSDQLNADDLIGGPITIKITGASVKKGTEQPASIFFEGDNGKPYKPCKSMMRVMVKAWGNDSQKYKGKSMTLYRDDKVKWAGAAVGGIRISHMSHIPEAITMSLTESKSNRKPFTVQPLAVSDVKPISDDEYAKLQSGISNAATEHSLIEIKNAIADQGPRMSLDQKNKLQELYKKQLDTVKNVPFPGD